MTMLTLFLLFAAPVPISKITYERWYIGDCCLVVMNNNDWHILDGKVVKENPLTVEYTYRHPYTSEQLPECDKTAQIVVGSLKNQASIHKTLKQAERAAMIVRVNDSREWRKRREWELFFDKITDRTKFYYDSFRTKK